MDTIFTNSENSKTSDLHRLLLNLSDKINLKKSDKYVSISSFIIFNTWKKMRKSYKTIGLKYQLQCRMKIFCNHGSYSLIDIQDYFKYIIKKHGPVTDNLPARIYLNKIENRITFKIKIGYYFELLTPETMKLLGNTKSYIN